MRVGKFFIFKEMPGIISKNSIYVFIDYYKNYLYSEESLIKLFVKVLLEWRQDQHLVS